MDISYLRQQYDSRKEEIRKRLQDFRRVQKESEDRLFAELAFCVLTPQSNGKRCWEAVEKLAASGLLYSGNADGIKKIIKTHARFHNTKARHIILNRKLIGGRIKEILGGFKDPKEAREWLAKNIKGFGYKEASHFLRNTGHWEDIAILDRHILKNLKRYGAIEEIPKNMTPKKYMEIESLMKNFAESAGIPFPDMDLLFWSEETGEVFK